ncbi:MAG TPA: ABC transporter permease subunit [Thermoanaerobaculia bacterium]
MRAAEFRHGSPELGLDGRSRRLEEATGTLGASPPLVFLIVTLPLILPGILAGMILSFAKAMGEFGATITFVSNIPGETQTLPSAIYTFTQVPGGEAGAFRLTLVAIAISMLALLGSEAMARLIGRRIGAE